MSETMLDMAESGQRRRHRDCLMSKRAARGRGERAMEERSGRLRLGAPGLRRPRPVPAVRRSRPFSLSQVMKTVVRAQVSDEHTTRAKRGIARELAPTAGLGRSMDGREWSPLRCLPASYAPRQECPSPPLRARQVVEGICSPATQPFRVAWQRRGGGDGTRDRALPPGPLRVRTRASRIIKRKRG